MTTAAEVEKQFASRFFQSDWCQFKKMADAYLQEAAMLKKRDLPTYGVSALLARNVRKRLLIGLGTELLLKALYLKNGFAINVSQSGDKKFPIRFEECPAAELGSTTVTFNRCLTKLDILLQLSHEELEGLKIAKVFRNKEAHSVLPSHVFAAETYRAIERSLRAVYWQGFNESLTVTISMGVGERAQWKVTNIAL